MTDYDDLLVYFQRFGPLLTILGNKPYASNFVIKQFFFVFLEYNLFLKTDTRGRNAETKLLNRRIYIYFKMAMFHSNILEKKKKLLN